MSSPRSSLTQPLLSPEGGEPGSLEVSAKPGLSNRSDRVERMNGANRASPDALRKIADSEVKSSEVGDEKSPIIVLSPAERDASPEELLNSSAQKQLVSSPSVNGHSSPSFRRPIQNRVVIALKGQKKWTRKTAAQLIDERKFNCSKTALATYAAMGLVLFLAVEMGIEYADTARELQILQTLNVLALGMFGSAFSNAAQSAFFLMTFVPELLTYLKELISGRLRGYTSAYQHIPFFVGRVITAAMAADNSAPVVLASAADPVVRDIALTTSMAPISYSAVSKCLDRLYFRGRAKFGTHRALEKEVHDLIGKIQSFFAAGTDEQKKVLMEMVVSQGSTAALSFRDELGLLRKMAEYIKIQKNDPGFFTHVADEKSEEGSLCAKHSVTGILSVCFIAYTLAQLPSMVLGSQKVFLAAEGGDASDPKVLANLALWAFTFGLMSGGVALARSFEWAVVRLFSTVKDLKDIMKKNPELSTGIGVAMGIGVVLALISPGGSVEAAVNGLKRADQVNLYGLTSLYNWVNQTNLSQLLTAVIPGYISGATINSTSNMGIAAKIYQLVCYYIELYKTQDPEGFIRKLEQEAFSKALGQAKDNILDGRHFSPSDLKEIKDLIIPETTRVPAESKIDGDDNGLTAPLLVREQPLEEVRRASAKSNTSDSLKKVPALLFGDTSAFGKQGSFLEASFDPA